jgi:hypothetical protein
MPHAVRNTFSLLMSRCTTPCSTQQARARAGGAWRHRSDRERELAAGQTRTSGARTHTHTHTRTHARMHARTHARTRLPPPAPRRTPHLAVHVLQGGQHVEHELPRVVLAQGQALLGVDVGVGVAVSGVLHEQPHAARVLRGQVRADDVGVVEARVHLPLLLHLRGVHGGVLLLSWAPRAVLWRTWRDGRGSCHARAPCSAGRRAAPGSPA